jgi:SHS family lactate transporter-like MFS transporter
MNTSSPGKLGANSRKAFFAGFMGWTFDAFDFFVLTYVLAQLAKDFNRPISDIALMLTASLLMRPVGAVLFGMLGDRYGRRRPLMLNILFNSCIEVLSGLAPSYHVLLLLRFLFGIGMGGVWGLGASLAMESVPPEKRGVFSGILQEGYAIGNLLAAVAFWTVFPHWGWRPMFFLSIVPALLTVYVLSTVEESKAWKAASAAKKDWGDYFGTIAANGKRLLYLAVLMSVMGFLSHGTQDLYPTFLQQGLHYTPSLTAIIGVISMLGAIVGGTLGGHFSDRHGRRRTMIAAELCALLLIPLWVFSHGVALIAAGAFCMQFMVQAAWGVIPAHINELIPDKVRALLPGLSYQIGILVAASAPYIQAVAVRYFTYPQVMGTVLAIVVVLGVIVIGAGPEARHVAFGQEPVPEKVSSV